MNDFSDNPGMLGRDGGDANLYSGLAVKTEKIIGTKVVSPQHEDLGKVEEIVLDMFNGRVAYLVLSFGGFLGMGESLYAVPWKALKYNREEDVYVLDSTKEQLLNAPGFEKETWPEFADERYNREVHAYYQLSPFWMA